MLSWSQSSIGLGLADRDSRAAAPFIAAMVDEH